MKKAVAVAANRSTFNMAESPDYFALFGLSPSFTLDLAALDSAYFAAQKDFHPDRLAAAGATERTQAIRQSVLLNDAYRTLKDPLKRAQYLLSQKGFLVGTERDTVKPNVALLTNILEKRELLAEAENDAMRCAIAEETEKEIETATNVFSDKFAKGDFEGAAQVALCLGYLYKLKEETRQHRLGIL